MKRWSIHILLVLAILFIVGAVLLATSAHGATWVNPIHNHTYSVGRPTGIPTFTVSEDVVADHGAIVDDGLDDIDEIEAAIAAATSSTAVYMPEGTYHISRAIQISKTIVLRGASTNTVIQRTGGGKIIELTRGSSFGTPINVTASVPRGSMTIPLASAPTTPVNVYLSQLNADYVNIEGYGGFDCTWCGIENGTRAQVQVVRILSMDGLVATLEHPTHFNLDVALDPEVMSVTLMTAGIENMTVLQAPGYTTANPSVELLYQRNSWVTNVVVGPNTGGGIKIRRSLNCEVAGNWIMPASTTGSGRGYGLWITEPNSGHLIYNNIVDRARHSLIFEGGGTGCVFAYNFCINVGTTDDPDWVMGDMDTHGAVPTLNLFEGNSAANITHDFTLGNALDNITFRCRITNTSRRPDGVIRTYSRWPIDFQSWSITNGVFGNIVGRFGDTGLKWATNILSTTTIAAYRIGFRTPSTSAFDTTDGPATLASFFRSDNWLTIDDTGLDEPSGLTLPDSLYLSAKPTFFGNITWPPVDPIRGVYHRIPAERRYYGSLSHLMGDTTRVQANEVIAATVVLKP